MGLKNSVEADEGENFCDSGGGVDDSEGVTRVAGAAVEGDEGGDAGGVDALDMTEVEGDVVAADEGGEAVEESAIVAADQFAEVTGLDAHGVVGSIDCAVHGATSKNLGSSGLGPFKGPGLPVVADVPYALLIALGRPKRRRGNMLQSQGIEAYPELLLGPGVFVPVFGVRM